MGVALVTVASSTGCRGIMLDTSLLSNAIAEFCV